ncbi:unnamed protein product [Medioppia subpectinata]|uniref:Uncharacterized protein n=1 Tax=Medioppia subpectinata TaxID=1979941 RepID=A0A7R9M0J4_9ACAR|nr:unnamed protein product [Medioppia subpectinata]CAG2123256.1 unnamed protein product [Medioppia subpectinata]
MRNDCQHWCLSLLFTHQRTLQCLLHCHHRHRQQYTPPQLLFTYQSSHFLTDIPYSG